MRIELSNEVALKVLSACAQTRKEISGFGYCEKGQGKLVVYDFVLLDHGTEVFTEIPSAIQVELANRPDAQKMKVWIH